MNIDLKNQSILQKIFFENKKNRKLEKNRAEKQKVKERRAETLEKSLKPMFLSKL